MWMLLQLPIEEAKKFYIKGIGKNIIIIILTLSGKFFSLLSERLDLFVFAGSLYFCFYNSSAMYC